MNFPSPHVMTARDDAGLDAFSHPGAHDEISNLSFDPHQIACAYAESGRMTRVQPKRIRMRDFIQPFRVRAARVNLDRQTESRDQDRLIRLKIFRMNVTGDVSRNRAFRPAPISERP